MNTKLDIHDFEFWYGSKHILHKIRMKIPEHSITALIGPSGCGKSTLLRSINRMNDLVPCARVKGNIFFNDMEIYSEHTDVVDLRKKIGMVFQKPNPFPMTVHENIAYGLRIQGLSKFKVDKTVKESLSKAELFGEVKDRLHSSAFRLSGGQQQRLCIARALAINPEILLLDEPCSALDPIATAKIEKLLKKLKDQHTIVIVTHNMQQARRVSDYTCYMYDGKIIEHGRTEDIFNRPKNRLTKDYINGEFG